MFPGLVSVIGDFAVGCVDSLNSLDLTGVVTASAFGVGLETWHIAKEAT